MSKLILALFCLITFSFTAVAQDRGRMDLDAIKTRVEMAVKEGKMTQKQADAVYKGIEERMALAKKQETKSKTKKDDGVQRKGSKSLPQSKECGKFQKGREGSRNGRSWGSRMRGCDETTNKGRRGSHRGCQVQNFRMWQRNRFFQSRHTMDQGKAVGRGKRDNKFSDRKRTKPSTREDSLQRSGRGRDKSRNKRLQK